MIKDRKYGIDILRIIAMLGVLGLHIIGQGGLINESTSCIDNWILFLFKILFFSSVNIFGLISGYLGYGKLKLNSYRAFELIMTVLAYSIVITVITMLLFGEVFDGLKSIMISLLPFMGGNEYWYIVCYIPILILQPYINKALISISEKEHKKLCVILFLVFSVIQTLFIKDLFYIRQGYSIPWLLCLYVWGAYIKRVNLSISCFKKMLLIAGSVTVIFGVKLIIHLLFNRNMDLLLTYSSPFVLFIALSMILSIKDVSVNNSIIRKLLIIFSATAFDVYIIHLHPVIFNNVLKNRFQILTLYNVFIQISVLILSQLVSYIILSLFAKVKAMLFEKTFKKIWEKIIKDKFSYSIN